MSKRGGYGGGTRSDNSGRFVIAPLVDLSSSLWIISERPEMPRRLLRPNKNLFVAGWGQQPQQHGGWGGRSGGGRPVGRNDAQGTSWGGGGYGGGGGGAGGGSKGVWGSGYKPSSGQNRSYQANRGTLLPFTRAGLEPFLQSVLAVLHTARAQPPEKSFPFAVRKCGQADKIRIESACNLLTGGRDGGGGDGNRFAALDDRFGGGGRQDTRGGNSFGGGRQDNR
jgi:hypothetical protein